MQPQLRDVYFSCLEPHRIWSRARVPWKATCLRCAWSKRSLAGRLGYSWLASGVDLTTRAAKRVHRVRARGLGAVNFLVYRLSQNAVVVVAVKALAQTILLI
jgi:hypothetical protein